MAGHTSALRAQARNLGILAQWRDADGDTVSMPADDLRSTVEKAKAMARSRELYAWTDAEALAPRPVPNSTAHAFWSEPTLATSATVKLPAHAQLGLHSAVARGGLNVTLWSYNARVVGAPAGVHVRNASELLGMPTAKRFLDAGAGIQHLSDWVRFLACRKHPGNPRSKTCQTPGAWFLDCDTLWFRGFGPQPSRSGHIFASMPASQTTRACRDARLLWQTRFVRKLMEALWVAVPFFFPTGSRALRDLVERMEELAASCTLRTQCRHYNLVMDMVVDAIHKHALHVDVLDTTAFCLAVKLSPFQTQSPPPQMTWAPSVGQNQLWFTSKPQAPELAPGAVEPDSFYAFAIESIGLPPRGQWPEDFFDRVAEPATFRPRTRKRKKSTDLSGGAGALSPWLWWNGMGLVTMMWQGLDITDIVRLSAVSQSVALAPSMGAYFRVIREIPRVDAHYAPGVTRMILRAEALELWLNVGLFFGPKHPFAPSIIACALVRWQAARRLAGDVPVDRRPRVAQAVACLGMIVGRSPESKLVLPWAPAFS